MDRRLEKPMSESKRTPGSSSKSGRRLTSAQAAEQLFEDLFSTQAAASPEGGPPPDREVVMLDRDLIDPNPYQPRKYFPRAGLAQLGLSMREVGQLQPIVVRPHPSRRGRYQIVAGERRWRASASEYGDLPVLRASLRQLSDYEVARISIEENEKREDVSPLARARGLMNLYKVSPGTSSSVSSSDLPSMVSPEPGVPGDTLSSQAQGKASWDEVAASVGLTKRSALRLVELLQLPEPIQNRIEELGLSEKHGRALLQLKASARAQEELLAQIEREELSGNEALRRAEALRGSAKEVAPAAKAASRVRGMNQAPESKGEQSSGGAGWDEALERLALQRLRAALGAVEAARLELERLQGPKKGPNKGMGPGSQERLLALAERLQAEAGRVQELLRGS
jgi:ParB family chromosome partitioning protein